MAVIVMGISACLQDTPNRALRRSETRHCRSEISQPPDDPTE